MPKYVSCGHYKGDCPCLDCLDTCSCIDRQSQVYAVDTDKLCARAKAYCESGREPGEEAYEAPKTKAAP